MPAFPRAAFAFLRELAAHNDKAWFHDHKARYEEAVRTPALEIIRAWGERFPSDDYIGLPRKVGGALSPPNRDVRFTADQTPYRTHVAIRFRHRLMLPGAPGPAFLLWVAPQGSFLAAGVHQHTAESLRRIQSAILADPDAWERARVGPLDGRDMRATLPPGVSEDHPHAEDLRRRHFTTQVPLTQKQLTAPDLTDRLAQETERMLPLCDFLADALYATPPGVPAR